MTGIEQARLQQWLSQQKHLRDRFSDAQVVTINAEHLVEGDIVLPEAPPRLAHITYDPIIVDHVRMAATPGTEPWNLVEITDETGIYWAWDVGEPVKVLSPRPVAVGGGDGAA